MCIITGPGSNGSSGHTPTITNRGRAGRGHMKGSMGGPRKNFSRHAFAHYFHTQGFKGWLRWVTLDINQHHTNCKYRRVVLAIRPW